MTSSTTSTHDLERGQSVYTPRLLNVYDFLVLRVCTEKVWRSSRQEMLDLYSEHMSDNHLDCGVGTGFFVDQTAKSESMRLALLDLNPNCLDVAYDRLKRFEPEIYERNILEPLPLHGERFDSVAMNYLIHCLPGQNIVEKAVAFDQVIPFMKDDAVVFGATVLGAEVERSGLARKAMELFNWRGVFCNEGDVIGDLVDVLHKRFRTCNVWLSGCVVFFVAKGVKDSSRLPEEAEPKSVNREASIVPAR